MLLNGRIRVAATTTLLTAIYPIWFAQSTLAHADMFAAAATLWGLVFVFPGRPHPRSVGRGGLLCRGGVVERNSHRYTPGHFSVGDVSRRAATTPTAADISAPHCCCLSRWLRWWPGMAISTTGPDCFGNPEFLRYNAPLRSPHCAFFWHSSSHSATHRAYEHVRARAVHAGGYALLPLPEADGPRGR